MSEHPTAVSIEEQEAPSRYVVGIDLGTTNSAVTYVDSQKKKWRVETLAIPQLVDFGSLESLETLPSFHYEPLSAEASGDSLRLPWSKSTRYCVGAFARDHGTKSPGRLIASAKSWLCHTGVDRTAELLPWRGAEDVERLSPVEVSARLLLHVRSAWNDRFPDQRLEDQDIVLTLPASFDEVARELTIEAANVAGLPRVVLIEEPQAAFYSWIDHHAANWQDLVEAGQKILVCDIGGGTSDFTLIRVREGEGERVQFHRVAVGEHLILGGDNLDLALAKHLETKLGDRKLEARQWDTLVKTCRVVKETLLSDDAPDNYTVNLPGSGSRLIAGGVRIEVTRTEVEEVLLEGFLPPTELNDQPDRRQSGFQEFGLPYASDAAITRYLAAFLSAHRHVDEVESNDNAGDPARPDVILFNGGFFASPVLRARLTEVITSWFDQNDDWAPLVLENERLDLAVARGAAYYGMVRRGEGVKISASLARSYYVGVDGPQATAVCLIPGSAEAGQDITLERQFKLLVSQPVQFPLYVSSTRLADTPGQLFPVDRDQMKSLPPIRTALKKRRRRDADVVAVNLHGRLTEIGTLDMWCAELEGDRRWRLQFDVRSATQTDIDAVATAGESQGVFDESLWDEVQQALEGSFDSAGQDSPEGLAKRLQKVTEMKRPKWPPSLLRRIWDALIELEEGRRRSAVHEARWLNLLGYALRPGYGMAVDDWRVNETWRLVQGRLAHHCPTSRTESLILWRRVAGGLSAGQQRAIAEPLLAPVRNLTRRLETGKGSGGSAISPHESMEVWRTLAALELLGAHTKIELGKMLASLVGKRKMEPVRPALVWALGRVGARQPFYGPLNTVVSVKHAHQWLESLIRLGDTDPLVHLAVMQLARRTNDRYRDLEEDRRREVVDWLECAGAAPHLCQLVAEGGHLDADEQGKIFGEALPTGLRLAE